MNGTAWVKKVNDTIQCTKKLFSAARYEEFISVGYQFSVWWMKELSERSGDLIEQVINDAMTTPGWYSELIHGRSSHEKFKSNYPELKNRFIDLVKELTGAELKSLLQGLQTVDDFLEGSQTYAVQFLQLIRTQVLIRSWAKFRKAYVFDKDLALSLCDMKNEVMIPLCLPKLMPFPTVYFELPDVSPLNSYSGVFITLRKDYGIKRISNENVRILQVLSDQSLNVTDDTRIWLNRQLNYNIADRDAVKEEDYLSLHLLFVGNNKDYMGFNETFTFIDPISADENGFCTITKDSIYEKICRDEFDDKEKLADTIMFILNALMYLGAKNADITTRKTSGVKKLKPRGKNKKKRLEFEDTDIELNECGFIYGASVRSYMAREQQKEREYEEKTGNRRPMRPHPVRAHYQHYHTGKGRKEISWILKSPYYNYGSIGTEAEPITNVSRVEKG